MKAFKCISIKTQLLFTCDVEHKTTSDQSYPLFGKKNVIRGLNWTEPDSFEKIVLSCG